MATKVIKFPVAYQPPVGEISSSVLWFFSQCLIYAGAALGIDVMIGKKLEKRND